MSQTIREFVEGETKPITPTLYDGSGSSATAIDGTGLTLSLVVVDRNGNTVPITGDVSWSTQASGIAKYEPDETDLKASGSPYAARWAVTDGNSDVAYYPNQEPERWVVRKP